MNPSVERLWLASAVAVFVAAGVSAQVTTKTLEIVLFGESCPDADHTVVTVVMDGKDDLRFRARPDPDSKESCSWKAETPKEFSTGFRHYFSLRVGVATARTDCQRPKSAGTLLAPTAKLTFDCCRFKPKPTYEVSVSSDAPMELGYLREVPAHTPEPIGSVRCIEKGPLGADDAIRHVQFSSETVRLHLGTADSAAGGLIINLLPKGDYRLRRDDVVYRFSIQRSKGDKSPPSISPDAIDIDNVKLAKAGLKTLAVEVK
jgi:hypothetical protein